MDTGLDEQYLQYRRILLSFLTSGGQAVGQQQLIMAIGRIERALSRIEQVPRPVADVGGDTDLIAKHERLKAETKAAIAELDQILAGQPR